MDPRDAVVETKAAIGALGGGFMISREVKALCERHGLGPREMYFRGRCGVGARMGVAWRPSKPPPSGPFRWGSSRPYACRSDKRGFRS